MTLKKIGQLFIIAGIIAFIHAFVLSMITDKIDIGIYLDLGFILSSIGFGISVAVFINKKNNPTIKR